MTVFFVSSALQKHQSMKLEWKASRWCTFIKNFSKSWKPVLEVQSSQLYNHKRQDNLINNSGTGSPRSSHMWSSSRSLYSPCERKPDHRHMLFIHSVCCADGDTRVLVWKWTSHPHAQLPIREAVSVERGHTSWGGGREPLVTTQSHYSDQYSSDTWR